MYNNFKIFIDVITFKLKLKDLKKYKEMKKILDEFLYRHGKPVPITQYTKFTKYSVSDYLDLIKFNNKYVKNKEDRITFERVLTLLEDEFQDYNNATIVGLKRELKNKIKDALHKTIMNTINKK